MYRLRTLAIALVGLASLPARAEDASSCSNFAWSVERERAAFANKDLPVVVSGSSVQPAEAVNLVLTLKPVADITLPFPSDRSAKPGTFAGVLTIPVSIDPGIYQITISNEAWIDVGQDEALALKPTAFSGQKTCAEVRKSVRFTLGAAPVTIQLSRAEMPAIKLNFSKINN